jgi:4-carboxymuconolactone decarboxylase
MAHVSLIAPESATPEQQAAFDAVAGHWGRVSNVFRAMGHSPAVMLPVSATGGALRAQSVLSLPLREAVILAVAGRWACAYEQHVHVSQALRAGLSEAAVAALGAGAVPADLPPLDTAAVRYAHALSRDGRADAALAAELRAALGEQGLVELTILVGWYSLLAMFLNGLAVDLDAR